MRTRRRRGRTGFALTALLFAACTSNGESDTTPPSTTTASATSTSQARPVVQVVPTRLRVIELPAVPLTAEGALAIGVHPTSVRVRVSVRASDRVEVCPASFDGEVDPRNNSWGERFPICVPFDSTGSVVLPATTGEQHVFFAVRSRDPSARTTTSVSVTYVTADAFAEIIAPVASTSLAVAVSPQTATIGALAIVLPDFAKAPDVTAQITQGDATLLDKTPCDFASEVECVRVARPGERAVVTLRGAGRPGARIAMLVSWA